MASKKKSKESKDKILELYVHLAELLNKINKNCPNISFFHLQHVKNLKFATPFIRGKTMLENLISQTRPSAKNLEKHVRSETIWICLPETEAA